MASRHTVRHIETMKLPDDNFLWASCLWGAVAGGYVIYGLRQKAAIPLAAGAVMTAMSFIGPNALIMSLVCVAVIAAAWWLLKQGY